MIERERLVRTRSWSALPGRPVGDDATEWMPWMALFEGRDQLGWYNRLRYLLSAESFSITDALLRKTLALQTQQQMALTAVALARYRRQLWDGRDAVWPVAASGERPRPQ